MGTKTKEQLEEEKKISLSIRIKPLELDGMDGDALKEKASELWEVIVRLETEKYDLEERQKLYEGGWDVLYAELLEKTWKEKMDDWGERPSKKPGDPESPDDEDEGPAEAPPGAEEEEEEEEEEDEEEEEEEE